MDLFILRHAIAVPHGSEGYVHDSDRPLTPKGKKKMRRIAEGMQALDLSFDLILSSPLVRARQTAEILAKVFKAEKNLKFTEHLAVGGDSKALIDEIDRKYGTLAGIVLVGHEPSLSQLISLLLSGDGGLSIMMRKGGLCKLTVDSLRHGRCATLDWLLTPGQMAHIG
jgi:phosphohistidine phosphatase